MRYADAKRVAEILAEVNQHTERINELTDELGRITERLDSHNKSLQAEADWQRRQRNL